MGEGAGSMGEGEGSKGGGSRDPPPPSSPPQIKYYCPREIVRWTIDWYTQSQLLMERSAAVAYLPLK